MENRLRILLLASLLTTDQRLCNHARLWPWHHEVDAQVAAQKADADADAAAAAPTRRRRPPSSSPRWFGARSRCPRSRPRIRARRNYGEISIESYTAAPVWGVTADYHITEDFFFEAAGGRALAGQTSFETLSGNIQLLTDAERQFTYYNLSVGYNFLPGEVFLGRNHAMTSSFYILGGLGGVKFEGNSTFAANFGAGFRVLPNDWLAIRIEAQDMVFKSDFLGTNRLRNNLKAYIGASVYF